MSDDGAGMEKEVLSHLMPDMSGKELARRISERHPGLKHVFMSSYTADIIARHGVLEEEVLFIQKPFSRAALAAKVREALDGR